MGRYDDIGILIIGGIATYFLLTTCELQRAVNKLGVPEISDIVNQIGAMVGATNCPSAPTTTGGAPPTGGGGTPGTIPSGGQDCPQDEDRWECEGVTDSDYEAIWCGRVPSGCSDTISIKAWGPGHHNTGDCCFCTLYVEQDSGRYKIGGEEHHVCDEQNKAVGDSGTPPSGNDICVKATIRQVSNGAHMEGFAQENGQWVKKVEYTGPCGCGSGTSTTPSPTQQVSFRFDCGDVQTTTAKVVPLGSGGGVTPGTTTGGGGGSGTPVNPNPPSPVGPGNTSDPCNNLRNSPGTWCACRQANGLGCNTGYARARSRLGNAHKIRNYNELRLRSVIPTPPVMTFR